MKSYLINISFLLLFLLMGIEGFSQKIKPGQWRAAIDRPDGNQIIFNFDVVDSVGRTYLYVRNAEERLVVDEVSTKGDSLLFQMPFFQSSFRARITPVGNLSGIWIKEYGNRTQVLPFSAIPTGYRFMVNKQPEVNISGRWSAPFIDKDGKSSTLIGEFTQKGSYLTGTFLNPTGDFRYLEGIVSGDSLKLSSFDGSHAYLFTARVEDTNKIVGGQFFYSGNGFAKWSAVKDANAQLPDENEATHVNPAAGKLNFSFPNILDSQMVSINDPRFKNKVVVVTIMGSWCPNCMDEAPFLVDYYNKNHERGVEIIALAYEYTTDFKASQKALTNFMRRFDIPYPVLLTGVTVYDSLLTQKTLPQLDKIKAFPTTFIVDKKGDIVNIHTGFDGPATGQHYLDYKKHFNEMMDRLLAE